MSLTLPKYEIYEQGSQVRRSSESVKDTIVEAYLPARQGHGRKRYKDDFIRFLTYSQNFCDKTILQLNVINDIHFQDNPLTKFINEYDILGKKINKFIQPACGMQVCIGKLVNT